MQSNRRRAPAPTPRAPRRESASFSSSFPSVDHIALTHCRLLRRAAEHLNFSVAIGLEALDKVRAVQSAAMILRGIRLGAANAFRRDLRAVETLRSEIIAYGLRATLGQMPVVARRADPVGMTGDFDRPVIGVRDLVLQLVEHGAARGLQSRAVEIEKRVRGYTERDRLRRGLRRGGNAWLFRRLGRGLCGPWSGRGGPHRLRLAAAKMHPRFPFAGVPA